MCNKIQSPKGTFDSTVLIWHGEHFNIAWIVVEHLSDFIEGENYREKFNTTFTIRGHHQVKAIEGFVLYTYRHY